MTNIGMQLLQKISIKFRLLAITVNNVVFNDLLRINFNALLFDNNVN